MKVLANKKPVSRRVLKALDRFEDRFLERLRLVAPEMSEPTLTAVKAGGKRLRPALAIICAGFGSNIEGGRLQAVCEAVELVHLASLVHDDVLDGSDTRRGVSTINSNFGPRRAILTGDYLFGLAFGILAEIDTDNSLIRPLAQASIHLSSGELHQRQTLRQLDQTIEDYLERIYTKTAALFVAACVMGAHLARCNESEKTALEEYACGLGTAFQIYDDILDFTGNESTLGKPVGSDIREGTITLPMIYALHRDDSGPLRDALERPDDQSVPAAVAFINGSGAIDLAKEEAARFAQRAQTALDKLPNFSAKKDLVSLGEFVVNRYQ